MQVKIVLFFFVECQRFSNNQIFFIHKEKNCQQYVWFFYIKIVPLHSK